MARLKTIYWNNNTLRMIDQTLLPTTLVSVDITDVKDVYNAIKTLMVRGAPAIGIAGAYGTYLGVAHLPESIDKDTFFDVLTKNADYLNSSRPTAVNLSWAINRMVRCAKTLVAEPVQKIKDALLAEAHAIYELDLKTCRAIGEYGYEELKGFTTLLTHCNAGGLATSEYGTALAPIYIGAEKGKKFSVFSDETRPLLQGSRITAFELAQAGIDVTVICDNMAAYAMSLGKIDAVIVGADRITRNGDVANKIGTYSVALVAKAHTIPFYVAAPLSTFDAVMKTGKEIPIEERAAEEITHGFGKRTAPENVKTFNPAFDVTPGTLVTAFITEKGIIRPPFTTSLPALLDAPHA